jgi:AAA family ATP:ADP antiporter
MNLITIALQFFAVGRLTKQVGVAADDRRRAALRGRGLPPDCGAPDLPDPGLRPGRAARRQYAIVRPCRKCSTRASTAEAKYKAKNVNDTLVYRTSDFVVAKAQDAVQTALQASLAGMALFRRGNRRGLGVVAWFLGRAHERNGAHQAQ